MCRALLYPLVCALSLVTAAALLLAGTTIRTTPPLDSPATTADTEAAVRAFYEAADAAIRTGNLDDFAAAVSPAFVDHAPPPGVAPDRAGLARYLAALHATSPHAEIAVADLVAVGDRALVRVAVRGAVPASFLGLPPEEEPSLWSSGDAWRVAGGRVVERWGDANRLVLREQLGRIDLRSPLPTFQVIALERLSVAPGARLETELPDEARLLYLEAGALAVAVAPGSPGSALLSSAGTADAAGRPTEVGPGGSARLRAGDLLTLQPLTAYALRNDATVPAAALVVAVHRPGAAAYATARCDSGVRGPRPACEAGATPTPSTFVGRRLAGGLATALPPGAVAVAVGRAVLAHGADLAVPAAAGPVLLYVEAGTPDLETGVGAAWVGRGGSGQRRAAATESLGAGDGVLLEAGTAAAVRNRGATAATVLVATLLPSSGVGPSS